jgi:dTMP kinase
MYNKKFFFVVFEGIEGSGKSYQSNKLNYNLKKKGFNTITTREPGGFSSAEAIRKLILTGKTNKFSMRTDTLLYLASRNEHFEKKIKPAISKRKIILCDRFVDSTIAYQVYGSGESKTFVQYIHKYILGNFKPDLTFVLTVNINKAFNRIKKRKNKNRYDKLSKNFYERAQKAFIKMAKCNKSRYKILDNSNDTNDVEKKILNYFISSFNSK